MSDFWRGGGGGDHRPDNTILMLPEIQCHDGYMCRIRIAMKYQYTSYLSQYNMVLQLNAFCR